MMKKLTSFFLGTSILLQSVCPFSFNATAGTNTNISADRVIQLEYDESEEPVEIEVYEGEQIQLDFQLDPEIYDLEYIQCFSSEKVVVSHTGKLIAYDSGQESVMVYVKVEDDFHTLGFAFNVNVLPNENISPENRAELNRLKDFWYMDYRRRKLELVGAIDEDAPRLTLEKVQQFIDTSEDYREIFKKVSNYVGYPDDVSGSGATSYAYWSDPKGNECIYIGYDNEYIAYTPTADDGTFIGSLMLYPEKTEFLPNGKDKSYEYIKYNQIKPKLEGYGTLNLKFIDESTDEPFTETNGTFQLIYNNVKGDIKIVKSWDSSEGSEITISELSRDYTYELRYIDKYHGEYPEEYKYEVSLEKGKRFFSFADDSELSCDIYLKKHILGEPYLLGDVNNDKMINVADAVTLQKWLMGKPNTVLMNWKAADLCRDDELNIFDLCLMKNKLIKTTAD
ncbi:MAG: dockerin type I repeat-containing protein [Ruminococcus sp.]|nr:dockerin type I repeat-containing protein [Ruminococcus sp.]